MKHLLKSFIFVALLSFAGFALADAAAVTPTINKGDTAWMIVATVLVSYFDGYPRISFILWRYGSR